MDFKIPLNIYEILIPTVGSGIVLASTLFCFYIYVTWKNKTYMAFSALSLAMFLFSVSEACIIIVGGYFLNQEVSFHINRLQQIIGSFFLFLLPFFSYFYCKCSKSIKKFFYFLTIVGIGISLSIITIAYINPDLYISIKTPIPNSYISQGSYGRGATGPLYLFRDFYLGFLFIVSIFAIILDYIKTKRKSSLMILIGLIFAIFGALNDMIPIHTGHYLGFFKDTKFQRALLGIIWFNVFVTITLLGNFLNKAKEVENAYRMVNKTEERFKQISENIDEAFWLMELNNNKEIKILYVSPGYEKIWNKPLKKLYDYPQSWMNDFSKSSLEFVLKHIKNNPKSFYFDHRVLSKNGKEIWINEKFNFISNKEGKIYRIARISRNITDKKVSEKKLSYVSSHDALTGLYNRDAFYNKCEETIAIAKRSKIDKLRAILIADIDDFKSINDSLGHDVGDEILIDVSKRIKDTVRNNDYVFRVSEDNFIILLNNLNNNTDAAIVADKILKNIFKPVKVQSKKLNISVSIGIALYPDDGKTITNLLKNAENALYNAKISKNNYKFYAKEMQDKAIKKLEIMTDMRKAIKNNEFFLVYQPIISSKNNKIVGAECLIRWDSPSLGFMSPGLFIPIAEETGIIYDIGKFVIDKGCETLKQVNKINPNLFLSINLSAKQFNKGDLVEIIIDKSLQHQINHNNLHLEITETALMNNYNDITKQIASIIKENFKLSIDDFGTGYSSLTQLEKLPFNTLKIDKSFIDDITLNKKKTYVVKAILDLAGGLNLDIIIEGIEELEQIQHLNQIGFDGSIQGYYYSKPLKYDDFFEFMKKNM